MARKSPKKTDHSYYELVSVVGVLETIFNPEKKTRTPPAMSMDINTLVAENVTTCLPPKSAAVKVYILIAIAKK